MEPYSAHHVQTGGIDWLDDLSESAGEKEFLAAIEAAVNQSGWKPGDPIGQNGGLLIRGNYTAETAPAFDNLFDELDLDVLDRWVAAEKRLDEYKSLLAVAASRSRKANAILNATENWKWDTQKWTAIPHENMGLLELYEKAVTSSRSLDKSLLDSLEPQHYPWLAAVELQSLAKRYCDEMRATCSDLEDQIAFLQQSAYEICTLADANGWSNNSLTNAEQTPDGDNDTMIVRRRRNAVDLGDGFLVDSFRNLNLADSAIAEAVAKSESQFLGSGRGETTEGRGAS